VSCRLDFTHRALAQIEDAQRWWLANRPAAPALLEVEFGATLARVCDHRTRAPRSRIRTFPMCIACGFDAQANTCSIASTRRRGDEANPDRRDLGRGTGRAAAAGVIDRACEPAGRRRG
jgi:hypothetical protein